MKLYLIVWNFEETDRGWEWTHVALEEYPNEKQTRRIISEFMLDTFEQNYGDDYMTDSVFVNTIDEVDGYKITVSKEQ